MIQIDDENIPVEYGGKCKCSGSCFESNEGPWNEVVVKEIEKKNGTPVWDDEDMSGYDLDKSLDEGEKCCIPKIPCGDDKPVRASLINI